MRLGVVHNRCTAIKACYQQDSHQAIAYFEKASKDRHTSTECLQYLCSTLPHSDRANEEASVLILSTLAVRVAALKSILAYLENMDKQSCFHTQISTSLQELVDQLMQASSASHTLRGVRPPNPNRVRVVQNEVKM